jgi:hypothetical protein
VTALDELRFGPGRTLNLRESLPTAAEAVRRAENYLREHQIKGSGEVLIITGRGANSPDGIGVIRAAVEKLLHSLRRRGVVESHAPHNPGAFAVRLAPVRSLADAPRRQRERIAPPHALHGLDAGTNELLQRLAERALDELGVRHEPGAIADEMQRQLRAIAPGLPGGSAMEPALRAALQRALDDYDG